MYLGAVVPTIDEGETITDLVHALDRFCDLVIVADAPVGQEFRTELAAQRAGARAMRIAKPGLDAAYRFAGYLVPEDWYVLHIDAGGSHDPLAAYEMCDLADQGFDVVIGSRFCPGGQHLGTRRRRLSSRFAAGMMNLISFLDIDDWTSGYRIYSPRAREVIREHDFASVGHAWQIEALWACTQAGMRIVEHPITYRPSASRLSAKRVGEAGRLYGRLIRE